MKKRMTLVIIMVFVCLSCAGIYYTNSQKSIKNVHISTIDFPGYAGELSDDIKIKKNIEDSDITNMDNLKYIYTNDYTVSKKYKTKLLNIFEMKNAKERKEDNRTLYTYKDSSISIYSNASFEYSNGKMGENKIDITDDEAKRIATDFLVNNNLLPDGFAFSGMGRDILQEGYNDEIEVSKIVYFSRYIDGSIVDGTSQVYVTLINNGEISYVYSSYMVEMKKNKIRSTNNIDIMENLETIINDDNYIDIDESADSIEISNIDVGYWEDSSPFSEENYMQPVYKLTGSEYSDGKKIGKFEIITQALQE